MTSSSQTVVFNGNSFVDNLNEILRVDKQGVNDADLNALDYIDSYIYPSSCSADGFFQSIKNDANPLVDWQSFYTAWKNYTGDNTDTLKNDFLKDFKLQIGYGSNGGSITGDWADLSTNISAENPSDITVNDDLINNFFKTSLADFFKSYQYVSSTDNSTAGDTAGTAKYFFTNWTTYLARTADLTSSYASSDTENGVTLSAYQKVYDLFFPDDPDGYKTTLKQFFDSQVIANGGGSADNGFFIPSQSFGAWFNQMRNDFIHQTHKSSLYVSTTADPSGSDGSLVIIDKIMRLLVNMTDVLQRISAAQAQQLSFLTAWQNTYTQMYVDVPQFVAGQDNPLGGDSSEGKAFRAQINPEMQSILQKVDAYRQQVQNAAKQMQTVISQTQDAANQQTQMATSLLQQLDTVLSQIFR